MVPANFRCSAARLLPDRHTRNTLVTWAKLELVVVVMTLDAAEPVSLNALLAKYVVMTRGHAGCRNVDLLSSATQPGRFVIVQKWDSHEAQQAHFDSAAMVEFAEACTGLLTGPPDIDLFDAISAHDLK